MADLTEPAATNANTAYEASDWPLRPIAWLAIGTLLFLVIAPLVMMWVYSNSVSDVSRRLSVQLPAPQLQTDPARDLAEFHAEEDRKLNTYYWVDKQKGIVHIPITEAMKKVAQQGIDGFPKATQ